MEKRIRLDKEKTFEVVTGSLCSFNGEKEQNYFHIGDSLLINAGDRIDAVGLLNKLKEFKLSRTKYLFFVRFLSRLNVVNSMVMALVLTMFVGFLGAFGNAFYEVLIKKEYDETLFLINGNQQFVLMIIAFFLVIFLAPQLISSDFTSINDWLEKRFSNTEKIHRQITRELLRFLRKQDNITRVKFINPWNYNQSQSLFVDHLASRLSKAGYIVEWHVRLDEVVQTTDIIEHRFDTSFTCLDGKLSDVIDYESVGEISALDLAQDEQRIVSLLMYCSTYLHGGNIGEDGSGFHELSTELAWVIIEQYRDKLMGYQSIDKALLNRVIQRCEEDYGLIQVDKVADKLRYKIRKPEGLVVDERDFRLLTESLKLDVKELKNELDDTIASLVLFSFFYDDTYLNVHKRVAAELFISNLLDQEQYNVLHKYGHLLFSDEDAERERNINIVLSAEYLLKLGLLGLKSGYYEESMKAYWSASLVYPIKAKIGLARVLERRGDYHGALKTIKEVEKSVNKKDRFYREDRMATLEIYLEKAWIIVSARFEQFRHEGELANEQACKILKELDNLDYDLTYLYSYHNNMANYYEWNNRYDKAIEYYEKVLVMPGMNIQPISSVYINCGIAHRLLAMEGEDSCVRVQQLKKSAQYIKEGVDLKKKIGDMDQFPIAIHNLAETTLLQALNTDDKQDRESLFASAYGYAREGLQVQKQISSIKKRGQLLAETLVALWFLKDSTKGQEIHEIVKSLIKWLDKFGSLHKFDRDAVANLLGHIGYDDEQNIKEWLIMVPESTTCTT